jgi:hypothetical protein
MCDISRKNVYIADNDDISEDAGIAYDLIMDGDFLEALKQIGYDISKLSRYDPK